MSEKITLKFKYSEDEYAAGQMLFERKVHQLTFKILAALALIAIGIFRQSFRSVFPAGQENFIFVAFGALFSITLTVRATLGARLTFRRTPKFNDEYSMVFSDDGIHLKTTSLDATFNWNLYDNILEDNKVFLLLYAQDNFTIVPKRAFNSEQQQNAFRALVNNKIGQKS